MAGELPAGFTLDSAQLPEGFTLDEEPDRSLLERVGRQVGLGVRALVETPGLAFAGASDIVAGGLNLGIEGFDRAGQALGDQPIDFRFSTDRAETVEEGFTRMGFPEAETGGERVVQGINRTLVGAALPIKGGQAIASTAASPVTRSVGKTLAANPAIQGTSVAAGEAAGGIVRESGGGQGAQIAAQLTGSLSPTVLRQVASSLSKAAFRGGEAGRQALDETVDEFARAGTTPTVGQGTGGRIAQATESLLSRTPGAAGRISAKASQQADDVAARVERIADDLAPKATAERAGAAIEKGAKGFVTRFQERASTLYDDVDQHLNTSGPTPLTKTAAYLEGQTAPVAGAEKTSQLLSNKFLDDIGVALKADVDAAIAAGVDGLPYSTVKALRGKVGERLGNMTLVEDVSKGQLKRLYKALSEDLTAYAQTQGTKAAQTAKRADAFYRAGRTRIDTIEKVINKNGGPEKVFNAAMAGTKEGATVLRTVMKSLKPDEQKMVAAAVVRRMGKATPGQQDATGEAFSINTFLTNWARLSPEARGTLFGRFGPKFKKDMDALAKFASNVRGGSAVFSNPSGTQQALTLQGTGAGAALSAVLGRFDVAGAILGGVASANLSARLMTNPNFVKWLATQTKVPAGGVATQVTTLSKMATDLKDRDIATFAAILQENPEDETDNGSR